MFSLGLAVFFDLVTVPLCCIVLLRWGRLGHAHPAAIYLVFHITTFTVRSIVVLLDRIPLFHSSGANFGTTSSWFLILQLWPGLSLLALMYRYGFRWWLNLPMGVYLLIMSFQGFDRFRVVIPVLLIVQIYLDRH